VFVAVHSCALMPTSMPRVLEQTQAVQVPQLHSTTIALQLRQCALLIKQRCSKAC
jgi:hypothetical protein